MLNELKFKEVLARWQESELSVKDFCFNEGITKSTFYYWLKKFRKQSEKNDFIPLIVKTSQSTLERQQQPGKFQQEENDDSFFELVYPNGTKLRIKTNPDLTLLKSLICLYP